MKQMHMNAMRIGKPNAARDISLMAADLIRQSEENFESGIRNQETSI